MYPFSLPEQYAFNGRSGTLAEHLGYSASDKLLIINADDLGLTAGVNRSIAELIAENLVTSTTLMVTAGDYRDAVNILMQNHSIPCGVHITMTSSLPESLIGPVCPPDSVPSLVDASGKFHFDRDLFFLNANPDEALHEATAQIELAIADGIDITHLDSHEGTMQLRPEFADRYLNLAARFRLPLRMASRALLDQIGLGEGWVERARRLNLQFPDNFVYLPIDGFANFAEKMHYMSRLIFCLPAGVTEIYFHPAAPQHEPRLTQSGRSDFANWTVRQWDYAILNSSEFRTAIVEQNIKLINFKHLRDLMHQQ
ncbi:MAG: ChbG/HpnK family deacetylase [Candidatus Zixiibacteriota bacterium]